jgi:DNA-directed RNA polymerase subunit RPC12/RpoP
MPKTMTILRTCPSCGHRFHVKRVHETLLSDRKVTEAVSKDGMMFNTGASAGIWGYPRGKVWSPPMGAQEKATFTTKRKEFEDSFKCARCGHQWSEKRSVESDLH